MRMKITGKQIMKLLGEKNQTKFIRTVFEPLKLRGDSDVFASWRVLDKERSQLMSGKKANSHSTFVTWAEKIENSLTYSQLLEKIAAYQSDNEEQRKAFLALFESDKTDRYMPHKLAEKIERKFTRREDCEAVLLLFLWSIYREDISLLSFLYTNEEPEHTPVPAEAAPDYKNAMTGAAFPQTILLPNMDFCGYQDEIAQGAAYLEQYHILFIYGIGGIGKTQLAKKLIQEHRQQYNRIIGLTYESTFCQMIIDDSFYVEGISRLYNADGVPESDEAFSMRKLMHFIRQTDEKTLVMIDNFDTQYDPMLETLLSGSYSLIITTRCNWSHLGLPTLHLTGLDEAARKELFIRYYKRRMTEENEEQLPELLRMLCGHPLAIALVAKLMTRNGLQPSDMIQILSFKGITPELTGEIPYGFGKAESIYDNIRKVFRIESLSDTEKQILKDMTLLPVKGTEPERFAACSGQSGLEGIMQLYDKSWVLYDESNHVIALHPLIADVIIVECCPTMDATKGFLQRFTDAIDNTWSMQLSEKQAYTDIALRILQRFPEVHPDYLPLYRNIAILLMRMEYSEQSSKLLRECLECTKQKYGDVSKETAEAHCRFAEQYANEGERFYALEQIEKAIKVAEQIMPYDLRTAYFVKYRAWVMLNRPQPEDFLSIPKLLRQTQYILEKYPDRNDRYYLDQTASLLTAYATYYYHLAEYETAEKYADSAYKAYCDLYGEQHADTISPLAVKALIYSKTGRSESALCLIQEVIRIAGLLFPEYSQVMILRHQMLADIYYNIGQIQTAIETMNSVCRSFLTASNGLRKLHQNAEEKLAAWKNEAS